MRTPQESAILIESLLKSAGSNTKRMLEECNLKGRVISNMKSGSMPGADKLAKIALYLGVSSDYLVGIEKEASTPSEVTGFSVLTDANKRLVIAIVREMLNLQST